MYRYIKNICIIYAAKEPTKKQKRFTVRAIIIIIIIVLRATQNKLTHTRDRCRKKRML